MEIAYCSFMDLFGIVDDDSLVWADPFYPFLVYGVGVAVCAVVLVPLKERLVMRRRTRWGAGVEFYLIAVVACLIMELAMGLLLNQPNELGEYPLWDNSVLPLNVLGQAWLVNDLALGGAAMFYTWAVYPLCERAMAKVPARAMNAAAVATVAGFAVLCAVKFS